MDVNEQVEILREQVDSLVDKKTIPWKKKDGIVGGYEHATNWQNQAYILLGVRCGKLNYAVKGSMEKDKDIAKAIKDDFRNMVKSNCKDFV